MASVLVNGMVAPTTHIKDADSIFEAKNVAREPHMEENTMVSSQKESSLEIGDLLSFGKDKKRGKASEVEDIEENVILDTIMVVNDLYRVEGQQWYMLSSVSNRVGDGEANPLISEEVYWETPTPLNSLHHLGL